MTYIVDGNKSSAILATSISSSSTTISLTSLVNWPTIVSPQVIRATITNSSGQTEIIDIYSSGTITRGVEGTTAQAFVSGSILQINPTAGKLQEKQNRIANADDVINFGDAVSLEIPNSASPTLNANGQLALDNTVTDYTDGLVCYRSGGTNYGLVAVPLSDLASPTDTYVVTYDAATDKFKLAAGGGGGGGSGDVVGPATAVANTPALYDGTTGELIKSLADPNADRILFWDDSAGTTDWLTLGTNLSITGTTLDASGGGGSPGGSTTQVQYNNAGAFAGEAGFVRNGSGAYTISNSFVVANLTFTSSTITIATNTDLNFTASGTGRYFFSGTSAVGVPIGSTAQRPSAATGLCRYNNTLGRFEYNQAGSWVQPLIDADFSVSTGIMQRTGAGAYSVLSSVTVALGGTGRTTSTTAYGVICAGTTATGAHQTVSPGTAGQVLTSNGSSALPTFQSANAPAFSARNSSTQTVTTGVITKIQLNSEDFDTGSYFDNATNYRFIPLIAGKYLFTFYFIGTITTSAAGAIAGYIYKNGAVIAKNFASYSAGAELYTTVTCIVDMNGSTDYIEGYGLLTPGTVVSAGCVLAGFRINI